MPCPVTSALGVGAVFGGAHTLFVQDHTGRPFTWATTVVLAAAWGAYLAWFREPAVRVGLEVVSVAAVVAAVWRLRRLARRDGVRSPLTVGALRLGRRVWAVIGTPAVLAAKVWLLAMLVAEWRGKARFDALEYALVSAVIVALVAHRVVVARRAPRFAALEAIAAGEPAGRCPLGFGCVTAARGADRPAVARDPEPRALEPAGWA